MIKPKKTIENIETYKTDLYKNKWRLKLDSNENIYGCSNSIVSAIKNFNCEDISLYPCYGKLIDKIALKHELKQNNILLTNGCDEAINIIINTYMNPEDEILSYNPAFSMPLIYAKCAGAKIKLVEYEEKFVFKKEQIKNNINKNTKIIYIATPNNPTGDVVKASVIELLVKEHEDILFLIDCTYINFANNAAFDDYIDLSKKYDNVAVVKSFSKDFALAGLRLGFVVAQEEIINNLKKIASPYNVNAIAIHCAISALNDEKYFEEIKELNNQSVELLTKGLQELGFKPYPTQANFVLCDFGDYCDFYYEKLKKNGVIVRNFSKNSPVSTCLRITAPKIGGVKYILELLNKKDLIIFDLDGVVFDVSQSYTSAIIQTFKHFANKEITADDVKAVKSKGGMNCDWTATQYLLAQHGFEVELKDIINVFQNLFYNPDEKDKEYLIDKEKLQISKETFEKLSKRYDFAVFSGRPKNEARYSLEKFEIDKYFYYYITADDLPKNMQKPHPKGAMEIIKHCPHCSIKYFGDSVDDVIAGNSANIETIGVITKDCDYNTMLNNFKHLGANYIIDDIEKIEDFLEEVEKNNVQN